MLYLDIRHTVIGYAGACWHGVIQLCRLHLQ